MSNFKSKKVLFLITKSNFGGAQKYVYELADATRQAGCEVLVACGGTGLAGATTGYLVEKLHAIGIKTYHVKNFQRDFSIFSDLLAFFEILILLWRERPAVLHSNSSKAGGVGAIAGRLALVKNIIFTSHGLTMDELWRPQWQRKIIAVGTWLTILFSHRSIMISTETYQRARAMPGLKNRVHLIKNGIGPIIFLDHDSARKKLLADTPTQAIWIGGIGELHPNKNWATAISALSALPERIHLFIIGDGEEKQSLTNRIVELQLQDRVHLVGYQSNASSLLTAFDIFLLPSLKEGLPYVLMEAGLAGLPIIATNLPGNQDIITTGETGLLIEPTDKAIATAIEMLNRDEGLRRRYGQAIKQKIETDFSLDKMIVETHRLYKIL